MFDAKRAYNDLSPLPPKAEVETRGILKKWGLARTALAELRQAGHIIPNSDVLIQAIPLLEAKDSSEIENIVTTNDALFREASLEQPDGEPAAKEALRYRRALYWGLDAIKARPLTARTATDICRIVTGIDLDVRGVPVTLKNRHTGETIYTPPQGQELIRTLLANWAEYLHGDDDIDALIRMTILHYQFEAIHPFEDGNGRTGRILNVLMLVESGLLDLPTLYLSRHILQTRGEYYRLLEGVTRDAAWEPWVLYMLTAVESTSKWTTRKIEAIRNLLDNTNAYVRDALPKIHSRELVDALFMQPFCRISTLTERGIVKRQSASLYLKDLASIGVLEEEKRGRDKLFINRKYLDLLGSDEHTFAPYPVQDAKEKRRS
jgi:Fic family protein